MRAGDKYRAAISRDTMLVEQIDRIHLEPLEPMPPRSS
jgi:hypothetical protein